MAGGQAITSGIGTASPGEELPVSGQESTSAVGSVVQSAAIALSGIAIAVAVGTIVANTPSDIVMVGEDATIETGNTGSARFTPLRSRKVGGGAAARALTGSQLTGFVGTFAFVSSITPASGSVSSSTGLFGKTRSIEITGSASTSVAGTVSASAGVFAMTINFESQTPEQIGIYLVPTRGIDVGSVTVRYRAVGAVTWIQAHPLLRIRADGSEGGGPTTLIDSFAGTIFNLVSNTNYEIEFTHIEAGQPNRTATATRATRALPGTAGTPNKTIAAGSSSATIQTAFNGLVAGDVIQFEAGTYTVSSLTVGNSGTTGSPIYIRGTSKTGVILSDTSGTALSIAASNVIVENLTIRGSLSDSGTNASSFGIDISGTRTNITVRGIDITGVDQGIVAFGAQTGVLVYNNLLTGNNLWNSAFVDTNLTWNDDGITLPGFGNCAWNNTLRYFGDAIAVVNGVGQRAEGLYFYRNRIHSCGDDAIEFDYGTRNIAMYDCVVTNCGTAMSMSYHFGGPVYYFRNTVVNTIRGPFKGNAEGTGITGFMIYNNTIVRTEGSTTYGTFQSSGGGGWQNYSFRNNIIVYRGGTGNTLAMAAGDNNPCDFTHNAWYPDGAFLWVDTGALSYGSLAAARSGLPSVANVFGTVQRHQSDVITVSDPFASDIVLGASHLTEYTASPAGALSVGTTPKNAGVAIPGITDGFSGAAPDMGSVIEGRTQPSVGHQPTWLDGLGLLTWRVLANTTLTTAGADAGIVAFSGAAYDSLRGRILVNGGGHGDSDGNGVWAINIRQDSPSVTMLMANSASVTANAHYYPDGKPSARHTYYNLQYMPTMDAMVHLGGAACYGHGSFDTPTVNVFNLNTNTWSAAGTYTSRPTEPGPGEGGCVDHLGNGYIMDWEGGTLRKWTPGGPPGAWSVLTGQQAYYDHCMVYDSLRQRIVLFTADFASRITLAGVSTPITFTGPGAGVAGNSGSSWVYCPDRDSFIGLQWGSGLSWWECNASSFNVVSLSIGGTAPTMPQDSGAFYGRLGIAPDLGVIYLVRDSASNIGVWRYR